jgi:hypothetical protein
MGIDPSIIDLHIRFAHLCKSLLGNYIKLFGIVKFLTLSSIPVEETVNSSCEINHCVWGCEKGCQLYELLLIPCAAVQQLPHVKRGACDWTVGGGGGGGGDALVPLF